MSEHAHGVPEFVLDSGLKHPYHVPEPSPWPIIGAAGGALILFGIVIAAHYQIFWFIAIGAIIVFTTMFYWFRHVVRESQISAGLHSPLVRLSLRYGMMFFITSEVMFFSAFFWAFFNFALFPEKLSSAISQPIWPPPGIHTPDPWHFAVLMTMILLLSGTTVTWAHHCLLERDNKGLVTGLTLTILLGVAFTCVQLWEYTHSPFVFWGGGIYPSVFFLATGFHGFHVIVGTTILIVCWFRARNNDFVPERHFGFEAAAWYWHFVDVVWLFLFTCIYWWGASAVVAGAGG